MHGQNRPTWNIRPASLADVQAIAAILRGLGWFSLINGESAAETDARIKRRLCLCLTGDSHSVLVAEAGAGAVLDYVAVHWLPYLILSGPEGYMSELFVTEAARGMGMGTRLLKR